jgi:hypothetical protein
LIQEVLCGSPIRHRLAALRFLANCFIAYIHVDALAQMLVAQYVVVAM